MHWSVGLNESQWLLLTTDVNSKYQAQIEKAKLLTASGDGSYLQLELIMHTDKKAWEHLWSSSWSINTYSTLQSRKNIETWSSRAWNVFYRIIMLTDKWGNNKIHNTKDKAFVLYPKPSVMLALFTTSLFQQQNGDSTVKFNYTPHYYMVNTIENRETNKALQPNTIVFKHMAVFPFKSYTQV